MNFVCHIIAVIVFSLAAFHVHFERLDILAVGLVFFVLGFIAPGGLPWAPRPPNA